jgi:2-polyprenyl-6-methoxyphenol hydroxylase-like FAD-dependent oxidoreductase
VRSKRIDSAGTAVVVGGSLTGLAVAIALARIGLRVTVLEQTVAGDRGGTGLGVDRLLLAEVTGVDPRSDTEQPHLPVIVTTRETSTWDAIHTWLLALASRIDRVTLREGIRVENVSQDAHGATVFTQQGTFEANVVIGADGYRSTVRRAVDATHPHASFGGFVIWRGLVGEDLLPQMSAGSFSDGRLPYPEVARLVAYFVPGANGSIRKGERQITFAWYDAAHTEWLRAHQIIDGSEVLHSVDGPSMDDALLRELHAGAQRSWDGLALATVTAALERGIIFGTPLTEYFPQHMANGRLAIAGDAAHVASPMVGHGLALGWLDAQALASAIARTGEANADALMLYERARLGRSQAHVAESMSATRALLAGVAGRHFSS